MGIHSEQLLELASYLFDPRSLAVLRSLSTTAPADIAALLDLDGQIGGLGISNINCGNSGIYAIEDRDVFRPIQYCAMIFSSADHMEWHARDIVLMSGLHLESLIKRVSRVYSLPLGALLQKAAVRRELDPACMQMLQKFADFYNDAKHNVGHEMDTHLFSAGDAIVAYLVSRKLGLSLYPKARLSTTVDAEVMK